MFTDQKVKGLICVRIQGITALPIENITFCEVTPYIPVCVSTFRRNEVFLSLVSENKPSKQQFCWPHAWVTLHS
jgi:hypothetical protein